MPFRSTQRTTIQTVPFCKTSNGNFFLSSTVCSFIFPTIKLCSDIHVHVQCTFIYSYIYMYMYNVHTFLVNSLRSKVDRTMDIVTGNPTVIKMVIHYTRCTTGGFSKSWMAIIIIFESYKTRHYSSTVMSIITCVCVCVCCVQR